MHGVRDKGGGLSAMAWICEKCKKTSASDSMQFPIMHGYVCDGEVVPDAGTVAAWGKVM